MLSIALPGSGHFYLGRRALAAAELLLGIVILVAGLTNLGVVFLRLIREEGRPLDLLWVCIPWLLVLACYSLLDGIFTWLVSRRRVVLAIARRDASSG